MTRHELDLMSLLAGIFFTLIGLGVVLHSATGVQLDGEWVVPVALIGVGIAGLVGSVASGAWNRREGSDGSDDESRHHDR